MKKNFEVFQKIIEILFYALFGKYFAIRAIPIIHDTLRGWMEGWTKCQLIFSFLIFILNLELNNAFESKKEVLFHNNIRL